MMNAGIVLPADTSVRYCPLCRELHDEDAGQKYRCESCSRLLCHKQVFRFDASSPYAHLLSFDAELSEAACGVAAPV